VFGGAAAHDLVGKKRMKVEDRIDLRRRGVLPSKAEKCHAAFHFAEDGPRLLPHSFRAGVARPHDEFAVTPFAFGRFTAAGDNARIVRDGFNGRVAQDDALAGAVRDCVANWTLWSGAARECAERYSVPAMAEQTLAVYRSLTHATVAHPLPRLH